MFKQSCFYGVIGLAALFLFIMQSAFAQPAKQGMPGMQQQQKMTPEEMVKKDEERITARVEEMTKNLGLTAQQQAQVKGILTATAAEIRSLMQQTRATIEGLMEKNREAIKALLTEEQKKIHEARRPKPGEGQAAFASSPQPPVEGK